MRKKVSILFMFLFIFSILIPYKAVKAAKGAEEVITVKPTFGVDGVYKSYREMPITLEVESLGKDIQGELDVIYPIQDGRGMDISQEISIASGDKKTLVLSIPVWDSLNKIVVKINQNDKVIYEQEFQLGNSRRISENKLIVGALSEDSESLSYMNSLSLSQSQNNASKVSGINFETTVMAVPVEFLKENSKILDIYDVIVIDNFDTSKLSKGQITAIKQWVEKGKLLIVGTGVYSNKTLSMFKDGYLGVSTDTLKTINGYQLLPFTMKNGEKIIDDQGYFQKETKNSGAIVISSYALGSEPFKTQIGKSSITKVLEDSVSSAMLEANYQYGEMDHRVQTMVGNVVDIKLPNLKVLFGLLILYALIVGPIMFIIFKKLKKSSGLWIAIPVMGLVFTVIISLVGGTTRLRNPIMNIKNFIQVDDAGEGKLNSVVGIMFPYKGDLSVEEPENSKLDNLLMNQWYGQGDQDSFKKNIAQKVSYVDGKRIYKNNGMSPFSPAYFSLAGENKKIGKIDSNIYFREGKIEGNLKNTLDFQLESSYLLTASGIYDLGNLEKGQSINLSEVKDKYKNLNDFNSAINNFSGAQTPEDMEERLRNNIKYSDLEYFTNKYLKIYGGNNITIGKNYLIGYIDGVMAENLNIGVAKVDKKEKTLVAIPLNLSYENNGVIEYPFGLIAPELNSKSTVRGFDSYNGYIYENGDAYLDYTVEKNLNVESIYFMQDTSSNNNYGGNLQKVSKFEVYNYKTNSYEELNIDLGKVEVKGDSYSKDGKIMTKATVNNANNGPVATPQIAVKGRAK